MDTVESPTCLMLRKVSLFWIDNNKNQVIIRFKRTTSLLILLSLRMLFAKAFQDFNLLLKIPAKRRKEKSALKGKSEKRKTQHYKTELPKSGIEKVMIIIK